MKILVTGGNGFLGKPVIEKLKIEHQVIAPSSKALNLLNPNVELNSIWLENPDAILHLAAKCGGILANKNNPADFLRDNTQMALNIFECARKHNIPYVYSLGTVCFTKDCLVKLNNLTYIQIDNIKLNDFVIGKDRPAKIEKLIRQIYTGNLIEIRSFGGEKITTTPEHPFLVKRNNNITWVPAQNLKSNDHLVLQTTDSSNKITNIKLNNINNSWRTKNLNNKTVALDTTIEITKELMEFFGWYLAEGYAATHTGEISIYLGENEQPTIDALQKITKKLFKRTLRVNHCRNQKGYRLDFSSKQLQEFLHDNFYLENAPRKTCHYKKIPSWIYNLEREMKISFLKAYIMGDGHISRRKYANGQFINTVQMTSASQNLIYQVRDLILSLGYYGSIHYRKPTISYIKSRKIQGNGSWTLKYSGSFCKKLVNDFFPEYREFLHPKTKRSRYNVECNSYDNVTDWCIPVLSKKEIYRQNIDIYNFSTTNETYNINGLIVHNCSYPKYCSVPFKEDDIWNGAAEETNFPYSQSKRTLMMLGQTYRQQYGIKGAHLIPTNMFGNHDHFDLTNSHVIPALIRKFDTAIEKNLPVVECWGSGAATREFLHVSDCADAITKAINIKLDTNLPINLGTGKEISIYKLAHLIKELTGFTGNAIFTNEVSDGQPRRCLDISRAKTLLNWTASTDLRTGLQQTIEWYRANKHQIID